MILRLIFLLTTFCISLSVHSQNDGWEMKKENDGIKVYTRKLEGQRFKEIRIKTKCKTSLNAIMAAFDDTAGHKDWVYKTPDSYTVEKVDENTLIYYIKSDLPFPLTDRDIVIKYSWTQDPDTKVITTVSEGISGKVDDIDGNIRVTDFLSEYILTPQEDGWIDIEYYAKMDPAGKLPAWLVNMAVTTGPIKTMEKFFEILQSGKYDKIMIEGVSELR